MSDAGRSLLPPPAKPLLIVLSGLSGAGKDAVLTGLRKSDHRLEFIVTVTTREKRHNEKDGVHYKFVSPAEFQQLIDRKELLEWARVYGNWYGVPKEPVRQALAKGKNVIVKVDVQGATTIKKTLPRAVFIFLAPPSTGELVKRLEERSTESLSDMELRIRTATEELEMLHLFDYIVINHPGKISRAVTEIESIITAEKCRVVPRDLPL